MEQNENLTQIYNPKTKRYVAKDKKTGKFVSGNSEENTNFVGVEEQK